MECGRTRRGQRDPKASGFLSVGVSKQKGPLGPLLSPFLLPTPPSFQRFATVDGSKAGVPLPPRPLELVWQAAKARRTELSLERPMASYFKRRAEIYEKGQVKRRYVATQEIGGAVLSWRTEKALGYVDSRRFYCEAYAKAVTSTKAYRFLESLCGEGGSDHRDEHQSISRIINEFELYTCP